MEEVLVNAEDASFIGGTNGDASRLVQEAVDIGMHILTILKSLLIPCSQAAIGMKEAKRPRTAAKHKECPRRNGPDFESVP